MWWWRKLWVQSAGRFCRSEHNYTSICMYVRVCICVCTCVCMCLYVVLRKWIENWVHSTQTLTVYMSVWFVCVHVCMRACMYVWSVCVHVCMCACMYVWVCVCVCGHTSHERCKSWNWHSETGFEVHPGTTPLTSLSKPQSISPTSSLINLIYLYTT